MSDPDTARRGPPRPLAAFVVMVAGAALLAFLQLAWRSAEERGTRALDLVTGRTLPGASTIAWAWPPWLSRRVRASDPETLRWILERAEDAADRRLRDFRTRLAALERVAPRAPVASAERTLVEVEAAVEAFRGGLEDGELERARRSLARLLPRLGEARDRVWALEEAVALDVREGD